MDAETANSSPHPPQARWDITRRHLSSAAAVIRAHGLGEASVEGCLTEYSAFLERNEFERALDMLEYACDSFSRAPVAFERLAVAAASLRLNDRASALRRHAASLSSMIAMITIHLIELDFESFEARLHQAGISFTVASRTASEYPGRGLPSQLRVGGRLSKHEYGYRWTRGGNGAILSMDAVPRSSSAQTHELIQDLERAFPECKPIVARDYPPVRWSLPDRAALGGIVAVLLLALYGLWSLIALLIHHLK